VRGGGTFGSNRTSAVDVEGVGVGPCGGSFTGADVVSFGVVGCVEEATSLVDAFGCAGGGE